MKPTYAIAPSTPFNGPRLEIIKCNTLDELEEIRWHFKANGVGLLQLETLVECRLYIHVCSYKGVNYYVEADSEDIYRMVLNDFMKYYRVTSETI